MTPVATRPECPYLSLDDVVKQLADIGLRFAQHIRQAQLFAAPLEEMPAQPVESLPLTSVSETDIDVRSSSNSDRRAAASTVHYVTVGHHWQHNVLLLVVVHAQLSCLRQQQGSD